jgi:hypothetical protein
MKKSEHFSWTPEAQEALDSLKNMLKSPPILTAPTPKELMLMYISGGVDSSKPCASSPQAYG